MAKKPVKVEPQLSAPPAHEDMTDEELASLAAADVKETLPPDELPVLPVVENLTPAVPVQKPHFVTSMHQGTLAEANRAARAQWDAQQLKLAEAHKIALAAVNKAFAGTNTPMSVIEAATITAVEATRK